MFLLQQLPDKVNVVERLQTKQRHYIPICFLIILWSLNTSASSEVIITSRLRSSYFSFSVLNVFLKVSFGALFMKINPDCQISRGLCVTCMTINKNTAVQLISCLDITLLYRLRFYANGFKITPGKAFLHSSLFLRVLP